jgi:hypothetical protein
VLPTAIACFFPICPCRTYTLDPGALKAEGQPTPLAPAQRMMLSAQVCVRLLSFWRLHVHGVLRLPCCQKNKGGFAHVL